MECSAKDNINIDKLFDDMAKLLMQKNFTVSSIVHLMIVLVSALRLGFARSS